MRRARDGFEVSALVVFGGGTLGVLVAGGYSFADGDSARGALMLALAVAQGLVLAQYLRRANWARNAILALSAFQLAYFAWQVWIDLDFLALVGIPVAAYVFYVIYDSRAKPAARTESRPVAR